MNENNNNNFESLGAHLRNLMTPYSTVIQLIDDLYKELMSEEAKDNDKKRNN